MAHTLIVMRHAKSSWGTGDPDHQRPLNKRGEKDAEVAGELLADYSIDLLLSSSATRTRQTWARAEAGGASAAEVEFTDALYGAWADTVVDLLRELDEEVGTVMVLGHEPTMSELVALLAEPSDLADEASAGYPTAALSVLEVDRSWADLVPGGATMVRFEVPRG